LASFYIILLCCSAATPGSLDVTSPITVGSTADYVCFTLRKPGSNEVVAIIIETKIEKFSQHAVAQAIGYYMAFTVPHPSSLMPLVIVLTEEKMHLVLFPFEQAGLPLVNAIEICLPLWIEGEAVGELPVPRLFNMKVLHILSSFVLAQYLNTQLLVSYPLNDAEPKGTLWDKIAPSEHQQLMQLHDELESQRDELESQREELMRLNDLLREKQA
jgi:hypothetical protein